MKTFDCIIIGGGMVGASSALSLAQLGLKIAVIEKVEPFAFSIEQAFDLRVSAISLSSQYLLESIGAWPLIKGMRSCPYQRLGVWEQEKSYIEFNAENISQSYLGHIVENRIIQLALWEKIKTNENIELFCPEAVNKFDQNESEVLVNLESQVIKGKILIAADGANSVIRQQTGIGITGWDYGQAAMLINVETEYPQQNITWQQFRTTGPVAMLPLAGNNASLVWYNNKSEVNRLSSLSNSQLCLEVNQQFPEKLGHIKQVIAKGAFPLTRRHANHYQQGQVILIGDAAHTINPLAGQGVNLGFKDVLALKNVIAEAIGNGEMWHSELVLSRYEQLRRPDNLLMMTTMDAFYGVFSHSSNFVKSFRNAGLSFINKSSRIKNKALAYACGI
ncbi:FAD-dependent oxidoreductase [Thalassotalea profundi]|uniref:2-octaprenyl-3-methyl-6-methoxy-1,4-benzoquinol hydroxylase n=1 Tax=Thalassotalea profundi TaxID=2036687 RepID=A0ABQ3IIT6_9GAMM|nr:FAD-dependent oxidoreductase [Thalassotalea profundi]GHE85084.1 2-octaprenyl-3-methyl-6-methoxy-1,4-benzoquinol hydroxylase [Thalassotalea profundi]